MRPYSGIIIHHSACSSINGKGYDFLVTSEGDIIPSFTPTDPHYIHLCLEGDFSHIESSGQTPQVQEQLFVIQRLILRLYEQFEFSSRQLYGHHLHCPGTYFPWDSLVISLQDGYH
ncbi:N-acetylmuramoyl-L-alanine amidase [Paenibacillus sp. 32O-W]|uniref:N-acetylmuramoyl-L-alanine amidase n=1 Tax=Paenibacillus sp. 32O-W TaxID=1695218 RepID=UPI00119E08C1|nr:N-acetylmuramoyl-L-alanine amidase [Paenibacillus sp. 32O-W]